MGWMMGFGWLGWVLVIALLGTIVVLLFRVLAGQDRSRDQRPPDPGHSKQL